MGLIDWLMVFVERSRLKAREDKPEACRIRVSKLAHERGGIAKAADTLIPPPQQPLETTGQTLRSKNPAAVSTGKAWAEQTT